MYVLAKRGGIVSNTPLPNKRHKQTNNPLGDDLFPLHFTPTLLRHLTVTFRYRESL